MGMFIFVLLLFVFGIVIGSFLNVLIYRTVHEESWVFGRSKCPKCKKQIAWYDNIPLVSFFVLRGKCRHCKKQISWSYPFIELITGLLFVWWFFIGFTFFRLSSQPFTVLQPGFWLSVGVLLIVVFFSDVIYGIIPDIAVVGLTFLGLLYRLLLFYSGIMYPLDFWRTLGGALAAFLFLLALWYGTKKRGIGLGDVKFAFPMGLITGWPGIVLALFLAFTVGAVVALGTVVTGQKKLSSRIAFGPFLVVGLIATLVWGQEILQWYFSLL